VGPDYLLEDGNRIEAAVPCPCAGWPTLVCAFHDKIENGGNATGPHELQTVDIAAFVAGSGNNSKGQKPQAGTGRNFSVRQGGFYPKLKKKKERRRSLEVTTEKSRRARAKLPVPKTKLGLVGAISQSLGG